MKINAVNTQWSYTNNKNSKTELLPDSIQFDLELERGRITLNLMKQSSESLKTLNIISQFQGQRSVWQPSEDEVSKQHCFQFEQALYLN